MTNQAITWFIEARIIVKRKSSITWNDKKDCSAFKKVELDVLGLIVKVLFW